MEPGRGRLGARQGRPAQPRGEGVRRRADGARDVRAQGRLAGPEAQLDGRRGVKLEARAPAARQPGRADGGEDRQRLPAATTCARFFIEVCDDDEMEEVVKLLGGTLEAQLNWMFIEGTSVKAVRRRIADHKPALRPASTSYDYLRDYFTTCVDNDEMAPMVDLIGGTLNERLKWMALGGHELRRRRGPDPRGLRHRPQDGRRRRARAPCSRDLSAKSCAQGRGDARPRRARHAQEVDSARARSRTGRRRTTPTRRPSGTSRPTRSSPSTSSSAPAPSCGSACGSSSPASPRRAAHLKLWRDGIDAVWKGKFHLENADGKKLPIVFDPVFDARDPHHTIKLLPPVADEGTGQDVKGRENAGSGTPARPPTASRPRTRRTAVGGPRVRPPGRA